LAHIGDEDLLARITQIEGPRWEALQREHPTRPYGLAHKQALWREFQASDLAQEPGVFWSDVLESLDHRVIYGEGGYHRYVVRDDGEVCFSRSHAREPSTAMAVKLGFRLC
jgi:hypothetical protein